MADDRQRIVEVSEETVNMARKELGDWLQTDDVGH